MLFIFYRLIIVLVFFFGLMLIYCEFDVFKDVCLSPIMPNICLDDRFCVFSSF